LVIIGTAEVAGRTRQIFIKRHDVGHHAVLSSSRREQYFVVIAYIPIGSLFCGLKLIKSFLFEAEGEGRAHYIPVPK
jgi:hypothetical protein